MSKAQTSQSINFATLKLAMDAESANMDALAELIQAAAPVSGVDVYA